MPRRRCLISRGLETTELDRLLSSSPTTSNSYAGIFPIDLLPRFGIERRKKPAFIVINLSPSSSEGSHWVLLFFPRADTQPAIYFDSFGLDLTSYPELQDFVKRNSKVGHISNHKRLQHDYSNGCGYFVLAAAHLLASGQDLESISSLFSRLGQDECDAQLVAMVSRIYHHLT